MIHAEALDFVHRKQNSSQEQFVFFLQRESKAVDNGTQDFQQLGNTVESLGLVGKLEKDVVDRSSNI